MWRWVETLFQDVRHGLRQLRRTPGFTAVAILTLALGIGANTAIFSVVNSVLLRPLPFTDPGRLVQLWETEESPGQFPLAGADYVDWQSRNQTLKGSSLYSWTHSMSAAGAGEPESAAVVDAQPNFFDVLGVRPFAGRGFDSYERATGKKLEAVISFGFWQRHFGGAKNALGQTIQLNYEPYTVVGIMPRWFNFPAATDVWTPLEMSSKELGPRGNHNWAALARIKNGVTLEQARADLRNISQNLEKQYPNSNTKVHAVVNPLSEEILGDSRTPILILFGAVTLVLLIACTNVANLLLARASGRNREMALRASLGARRSRLVRQLLTESLMLGMGGALLGTLGAWWSVRLLESTQAVPMPRAIPVQVDVTVLLFTIALTVITGILFGLAPALQASRLNLVEELKASAQSVLAPAGKRRFLRDALVVGEIAMTLALLVGAGLLLRSLDRLRNVDFGVDSRNVLTMAVNLPETKYPGLPERRRFFDQLLARVERTPGVTAASVSTEIPLEGGSNGYIHVEGRTDPTLAGQLVGWNFITPGYFRTLGIPVISGRTFTPADDETMAATAARLTELYKAAAGGEMKMPHDVTFDAVISQATARTFWPNQDPVGRSFTWNDVKVVVIGVVKDVKEYGLREKALPQAYFPLALSLSDGGFGRLTVRTGIPPSRLLNPIRADAAAIDRGLAMLGARTMDEVVASHTRDMSSQAFLLGVFAMLALALAAVGLYGVMSYLVTQRTREIGVRMAVGAERGDVLRLIMKQGAVLTITGVVLGLVASVVLTRFVSRLLYDVQPTDPATFLIVTVLLALVAFLAYYIPARRASRLDPMAALHYE
jgi:putative ABC transport system permease protein